MNVKRVLNGFEGNLYANKLSIPYISDFDNLASDEKFVARQMLLLIIFHVDIILAVEEIVVQGVLIFVKMHAKRAFGIFVNLVGLASAQLSGKIFLFAHYIGSRAQLRKGGWVRKTEFVYSERFSNFVSKFFCIAIMCC